MKSIINLLDKLFIKKRHPIHKIHSYLFMICIILIFAFTTSCQVKVVNLSEKEDVVEDEIKIYFSADDFDTSEIISVLPVLTAEKPYHLKK